MKFLFTVLVISFGFSSVFGQGRSNLAHLKHYDTTDVRMNDNKIKERKPQTEIDSTSILMGLWPDSLNQYECSMEINLIQPLYAFADFVTIDTVNGFPRIQMGSNIFSYEVYVREDGNVEWNAILWEKPGNRTSITYDLNYTNLEFHYQDTLSDSLLTLFDYDAPEGYIKGNKNNYVPDSVAGGYSVYRADGKKDCYGETSEYYYTGKAFQIYRPKAWDSNGDTVWVNIEIDTVASTLTLSLERNWLRDAVYPVLIDPTFGYTTMGSSQTWYSNNPKANFDGTYNTVSYTASSGDQVDSLVCGINQYMSDTPDGGIALYRYNTSTDLPTAFVDSVHFTVNTSGDTWYAVATGGWSLTADTSYCVAQVNISGDPGYYKYDRPGPGQKITYDNTATNTFNSSWTSSGTQDSWIVSMYAYYSTGGGGGGTTPPRRRKVMLK